MEKSGSEFNSQLDASLDKKQYGILFEVIIDYISQYFLRSFPTAEGYEMELTKSPDRFLISIKNLCDISLLPVIIDWLIYFQIDCVTRCALCGSERAEAEISNPN